MIARAFRRDARGATAVETALVLPLALLLLIGTFEISSLIFASWSLRSASHEVARYGATGYEDADGLRTTKIREIVVDRSLNVIDASDINVTTRVLPDMEGLLAAISQPGGRSGPGGPNDFVLYTVTGLWRPATPFFSAIIDQVPLEIRVPVMNEPF